MKNRLEWGLLLVAFCMIYNVGMGQIELGKKGEKEFYNEPYRPQWHFSPKEKWMNDPNGLVYYKGVYHLFYQYYPEDIVWGPMHWGHAVSKDLLHWEHKPIALYPDGHGYIFSGSAVVDTHNTSGLGSLENPPMIAVYTYHDPKGEKEGRNDYQTQGMAYSLDQGDSWTKYKGNPIIKNDGYKDFRDPKVFWNDKSNKWTMFLVAGDHLQIWLSDNLIDWQKVSEFGRDQGAHGGVWECPDMFPLQVEGSTEEKWVLLISINPGAPNGGSGTQYFIGDFDGKTFTSDQKESRWLDWGMDDYAGVTYNNTPNNKRIFIGWMSNWLYGQQVPTQKWRSAMTVPRILSLKKNGDTLSLINYPIPRFEAIVDSGVSKNIAIDKGKKTQVDFANFNQAQVSFTTNAKDFQLVFKNRLGEHLDLNLDDNKQMFLLDRSQSGRADFQKDFAAKVQRMPIGNLPNGPIEVRILLDRSSVEIFINKGQYVMTAQIFPKENYDTLSIENCSESSIIFRDFEVDGIQGVWRK